MFYTFVSSTSEPRAKRSSQQQSQKQRRQTVPRACDRCRLHRVRCELQTPCSRCVAGGSRCTRGKVRHDVAFSPMARVSQGVAKGKPSIEPCTEAQQNSNHHHSQVSDKSTCKTVVEALQHSPVESRRHGRRRDSERYSNFSATQLTFQSGSDQAFGEATPGTSRSILSRRKSRSETITSFVEFASTALHQVPEDPIFIEYDTPISVYHTSSLDSDAPPVTQLSKQEADCLLNLYWQTLDVDMPILERDTFEEEYERLWTPGSRSQKPSPLFDAVTAVASQYAHGSDLVGRIPPLKALQCSYHGDVALAAFCYLRRSRKSIEDVGTMADPSLTIVQTYTFIITYLLNAGQYETAYTMIGLAVRMAYSLCLPTGGTDNNTTVNPLQADRHRRTWWTLVQLDLKCSMELGRPIAARHSSALALLLSAVRESEPVLLHLQYQHCRSKLTAAMLQVHETLQRHTADEPAFDAAIVGMAPEELDHSLCPLTEWRREMSTLEMFNSLQLDTTTEVGGGSVRTKIKNSPLNPTWKHTQSVRISLQYHDYLNKVYRPCIIYATSSRNSNSTVIGDEGVGRLHLDHVASCARKCADHAMAITDIIQTALQESDAFYGCFELYMLQWNAVLSLIAFTVAYPDTLSLTAVGDKLDMALLVFEMGETRNAVARRASFLTRRLKARVTGSNTGRQQQRMSSPPEVPSLKGCQQQHSSCPNNLHASEPRPQQETQFSPPPAWAETNEGGDMWSWFQNFDTSTWGSQFSDFEDLLGMDYYDLTNDSSLCGKTNTGVD